MLDDDIQCLGVKPAQRPRVTTAVTGFALHVEKHGNEEQYRMMFRKAKTNTVVVGRKPPGNNESGPQSGSDSAKAMFRCPVVSRMHAKFTFSDSGLLYVTDTSSHHGTHIRQPRDLLSTMIATETPVPVHDGDVITFGKTVGRNNEVVRPVVARVELIFSKPTPTLPRTPTSIVKSTSPSSGRYGLRLSVSDDSSNSSSASSSSEDMDVSPSSNDSDHDSDIVEISNPAEVHKSKSNDHRSLRDLLTLPSHAPPTRYTPMNFPSGLPHMMGSPSPFVTNGLHQRLATSALPSPIASPSNGGADNDNNTGIFPVQNIDVNEPEKSDNNNGTDSRNIPFPLGLPGITSLSLLDRIGSRNGNSFTVRADPPRMPIDSIQTRALHSVPGPFRDYYQNLLAKSTSSDSTSLAAPAGRDTNASLAARRARMRFRLADKYLHPQRNHRRSGSSSGPSSRHSSLAATGRKSRSRSSSPMELATPSPPISSPPSLNLLARVYEPAIDPSRNLSNTSESHFSSSASNAPPPKSNEGSAWSPPHPFSPLSPSFSSWPSPGLSAPEQNHEQEPLSLLSPTFPPARYEGFLTPPPPHASVLSGPWGELLDDFAVSTEAQVGVDAGADAGDTAAAGQGDGAADVPAVASSVGGDTTAAEPIVSRVPDVVTSSPETGAPAPKVVDLDLEADDSDKDGEGDEEESSPPGTWCGPQHQPSMSLSDFVDADADADMDVSNDDNDGHAAHGEHISEHAEGSGVAHRCLADEISAMDEEHEDVAAFREAHETPHQEDMDDWARHQSQAYDVYDINLLLKVDADINVDAGTTGNAADASSNATASTDLANTTSDANGPIDTVAPATASNNASVLQLGSSRLAELLSSFRERFSGTGADTGATDAGANSSNPNTTVTMELIEALKSANEKRLRDIDHQLTVMKTNITALQLHRKKYKSRFNENVSTMNDKMNELGEVSSELSDVQIILDGLRSSVKTMQNDADCARSDVQGLKDQLVSVQADLADVIGLRRSVDLLRGDLEELKDLRDLDMSDLRDFRADMDYMRRDVDDLGGSGMKGDVDELREDVDGLRREVEDLKAEANGAEARDQDRTGELEGISRQVNDIKSKVDEAVQSVARVSGELMALDSSSRERKDELETEMKQLARLNDSRDESHEVKMREMQGLIKEITEMHSQSARSLSLLEAARTQAENELKTIVAARVAAEVAQVQAASDIAAVAANAAAYTRISQQQPLSSLKRKRADDIEDEDNVSVGNANVGMGMSKDACDDENEEQTMMSVDVEAPSMSFVGSDSNSDASIVMANTANSSNATSGSMTVSSNVDGILVPSPKRARMDNATGSRMRKVGSVVAQTATVMTVGAVAAWTALAFS